MEYRKYPEQIVDITIRAILGPRVTGIITAVHRDIQDPDFWHLLVQTDKGERYFVRRGTFHVSQYGEPAIPSFLFFRRGDQFVDNVRGEGVSWWVKRGLERDPFHRNS